jgi:hypothetical protein
MREKGWETMANFAFSTSYAPGQADDSNFIEGVLVPILGDGASPQAAALRRLFFESYTMNVAEMRRKLERTDEDPPRRLPLAEKAARLAKVQARLQGLKIEGQLEPSHRLIDLCVQFAEDNQIKYIEWHDCTQRSQEVLSIKKDKQLNERVWTPDASGVVRERAKQPDSRADVRSDLRLRQALQRRGLALEIADLMRYETHELLVEKLFEEFLREPLEGYFGVATQQIQAADRHAFVRLAELCRTGVQRTPSGTYPLEAAMTVTLTKPAFSFLLMQRQASRRKASPEKGESHNRSCAASSALSAEVR